MVEPPLQYFESKVLVIDDIATMRAQIVSHLTSMGFKNISSGNSCQHALSQIELVKFDLILCDYHLGEMTSGQQFLEHIRTKDLIPTTTMFVMVTAKRAYEEVVRAAEFAPDDYLVKPFSGAQLNARLRKLFDRRNRFREVHAAIAESDWNLAITLCNGVITAGDRFAMEASKLKGIALLRAKRPIEAEKLYRSVLAVRSLGWAELGLAKSLAAQNSLAAAEQVLNAIVNGGAKYSASDRMGAYDELVTVFEATERNNEALALVKNAMKVSSGSLARARKLINLAMDQGDVALAEQAVRKLIADNRHSHVKMAGDYLLAADVLTQAGFHNDALVAVSDVRKSFVAPQDVQTLVVAEATAHIGKGNEETATKLLRSVTLDAASSLAPATAAALGKSLYRMGDEEAADKVMRHLIQNNPGNKEVMRSVHRVMSAVGKQDEISAFVAASLSEVAEINDDGVRLAYAGKLDEAIALLTKAAELLPGNMQFVSNAALVMALALSKSERVDQEQLETCLRYRQAVIEREPANQKLLQIDGLLKKIRGGQQYDAASRSA